MQLGAWLAHAADLLTSRNPWQAGLIGLAIGWLICPGYMYMLAVVSEWRWPKYRQQFKAFMPGNLFLGIVFGGVCYLMAEYRQEGPIAPVFQGSWWFWLPLVAGAVLVGALSAMDIAGAFTHKPGDKHRYHWRQLISWTKLWHNIFVYGVYGYLLVRVGVPGLFKAPWDWDGTLVRVVVCICLARWIFYLVEDAKQPKCDTAHVCVNFVQWCIGLVVVAATCWAVAAI